MLAGTKIARCMKVGILLLLSVVAAMGEPLELADMRQKWTTAKERVVRPLDDSYVKALNDLKARYTKAGDLDSALLVDAEIKKVAATAMGGDANPFGDELVVDATKGEGAPIGELSPGQKITLQYVKGEWNAFPGLATESPDSAEVQVNRIGLYVQTAGGSKMLANPVDTKRKAFVFEVTEKGNYFIRINDNMLEDNKGTVNYRVTIEGRAK